MSLGSLLRAQFTKTITSNTLVLRPGISLLSLNASLGEGFLKPLGENIRNWLEEIGTGIKDSLLKAVPKQKTSYAKKRKRASGKGLKNLKNIVCCLSCGQPKLMHHLCPNCYGEFRTRAKQQRDTTESPSA